MVARSAFECCCLTFVVARLTFEHRCSAFEGLCLTFCVARSTSSCACLTFPSAASAYSGKGTSCGVLDSCCSLRVFSMHLSYKLRLSHPLLNSVEMDTHQ